MRIVVTRKWTFEWRRAVVLLFLRRGAFQRARSTGAEVKTAMSMRSREKKLNKNQNFD